jgi:FkbM family methyltransferase
MYGVASNPYVRRGFEPRMREVIRSVVEPGWVCVDAGSHQGYYAILFASIVGAAGHVVAFEANPDNASAVRRNVARNRLDRAVVVNEVALVGAKVGSVSLYAGRDDDSSAWNLSAPDVASRANPIRNVPATRLDDYFGVEDRVDFIKMDIEGSEVAALRGSRRLLAAQKPAILVEFHGPRRAAISARLLRRFGYRLYDVDRGVPIEADAPTLHAYHCLAVTADRYDAVIARLTEPIR